MLSSSIELTTAHGKIRVRHFWCQDGDCLVASNVDESKDRPSVRIHSSCVFSESLGSLDCDCALQLQKSLEQVCSEGGFVLYRFEEGRGTGLKNKIEAISLQQKRGIDTKSAFETLGFPADPRTYSVAVRAIQALNLGPKVILKTNNPRKIKALEDAGFEVEREALQIDRDERVQAYFDQKKQCLGHIDDE